MLSPPSTVATCLDKWKTYQFFLKHHIPTPATSLEQEYTLIKPRVGRGGEGVFINKENQAVNMFGNISQEFLVGQEVTIDVFCDKNGDPIYIIPRKRLNVVNGKSVSGVTFYSESIRDWVRKICAALFFQGPINLQCFIDEKEQVKFTEINPRLAGGMALGFAATNDNWAKLIVDHFIDHKPIRAKSVNYQLKMYRYYDEIFVS